MEELRTMQDRGMPTRTLSRRRFLALGAGTTAALTLLSQLPAAPALAATRAAPAKQSSPNLKLWLLKTYVEPTNQAIEASAQEWAQKNNATVTVEYFTFEDIQTKYVAAIETGSTPDVGQLETGAPIRFAGMGQLLDLTEFAKQIEGTIGKPKENFRPVVFTPDGRQVAIPWYSMHAFWYVWRDVLEKKGVKLPDTYEDALAVAKEVTDPVNGFYGIGQSWNRTSDGYGVMQSLMYSYGAHWADENGKYVSIKTPEMRAALKWAVDIYQEGLSPPDTLSWTGSQNNENFIAKKIAQTSNGPSITYAMENAVANATDAADKKAKALANVVALAHPAGPAGRRSWAIAMSAGIFKSTKNPDAAMSLVEWLLSPEQQVKVMQHSYGQFAPALDKTQEASKEYFSKNENYQRFGRAADFFAPTGWPGPVTAAAAEVQASNVLTDMPAKVIVDKWSIDQAIEWGDQKIAEIYQSLG